MSRRRPALPGPRPAASEDRPVTDRVVRFSYGELWIVDVVNRQVEVYHLADEAAGGPIDPPAGPTIMTPPAALSPIALPGGIAIPVASLSRG